MPVKQERGYIASSTSMLLFSCVYMYQYSTTATELYTLLTVLCGVWCCVNINSYFLFEHGIVSSTHHV